MKTHMSNLAIYVILLFLVNKLRSTNDTRVSTFVVCIDYFFWGSPKDHNAHLWFLSSLTELKSANDIRVERFHTFFSSEFP